MTGERPRLLPAYPLLAAGGVALGVMVMHCADQGTIAWSRLPSSVLLVLLAAGSVRCAQHHVVQNNTTSTTSWNEA